MFDDNDNNDNDEHIEYTSVQCGTLDALRDHALYLFGKHVAKLTKLPIPLMIEEQRQFLSIDETEEIVREHSVPNGPPGMYAVGGNSKEEYETQIRKLFMALLTRIEANVARVGVKLGYLDCAFDNEKNDFVFTVSKLGEQLVDRHNKRRNTEPSNN